MPGLVITFVCLSCHGLSSGGPSSLLMGVCFHSFSFVAVHGCAFPFIHLPLLVGGHLHSCVVGFIGGCLCSLVGVCIQCGGAVASK